MRLAGTAALCVLQNVKTTLENALRSGERTVLEDLKEAQQQTVALMRQNDRKARWVRVLVSMCRQPLHWNDLDTTRAQGRDAIKLNTCYKTEHAYNHA